VAYCPPLWFAWMDRRVMGHYGGNLNRVNLQPSARPSLMQRWG
jgi:alkane 1-monooxygenase